MRPIQPEGEKQGAEITTRAKLEVATIQEEVAKLDAQRTEILCKAKADVQKMAKQAEAAG